MAQPGGFLPSSRPAFTNSERLTRHPEVGRKAYLPYHARPGEVPDTGDSTIGPAGGRATSLVGAENPLCIYSKKQFRRFDREHRPSGPQAPHPPDATITKHNRDPQVQDRRQT
jgi:hypothetical protein